MFRRDQSITCIAVAVVGFCGCGMAAAQVSQVAARLSADEARSVLAAFEEVLHERHAHAHIIGFDIRSAVQGAQDRIGDEITLNELVMLMEGVLAPIGDGHASIRVEGDARDAMRGISDGGNAAFLPFRVKMLREGKGDPVLAIRTDREGFVDADHPVLESIDGVPIERWIEAASAHIPAGAPAYMRSRSLRELRDLWRWREVLGVSASEEVKLELVTLEEPRRRTTVTMRVANRPSARSVWPQRESQVLEGGEGGGWNIGYLRIPTMRRDPDELDDLRDWMDAFRETRGLIIDVRGNSGGRRHVLNMMGGYLVGGVGPEDEPVVYIAVRPFKVDSGPGEALSERQRERMASRYIFPLDHEGWTEAERAAVERFRAGFSGGPDEGDGGARLERFGEWHYAVLSAGGHERTYHYSAPVVVLMDEFCFSSTDNFVHAMGLLPNVTLMGRPSAASSGAPMVWNLPIEGVSARLASMASWRSNGWRFDDGRPQEPDVRVDPLPTCYTGETDVVLEAAVRRLLQPGVRGPRY